MSRLSRRKQRLVNDRLDASILYTMEQVARHGFELSDHKPEPDGDQKIAEIMRLKRKNPKEWQRRVEATRWVAETFLVNDTEMQEFVRKEDPQYVDDVLRRHRSPN